MKKIIIFITVVFAFLFSSCSITPYDSIEIKTEELPLTESGDLLKIALEALQNDSDVIDVFSYTKQTIDFDDFGQIKTEIAVCSYKDKIGYVKTSRDYSIYYKMGSLYTKGDYETDLTHTFEEDIKDYVKSFYSASIKLINECDEAEVFSTRIGRESYYSIMIKNEIETELTDDNIAQFFIRLYFNKDKEFVGAMIVKDKIECVYTGTFNYADNTFIKEEYEDVYEWMNYPDNFSGYELIHIKTDA